MKVIEAEPPAAQQTVEERVAGKRRQALEQLARKASRPDAALARLPDDELTREAWAIGEAWRKSEPSR